MAGVYLHIPFCKSKCNYCNFYSVANLSNKDNYIKALIKEIELQKDYLTGEEISTIYFGGGTPSLLSVSEINSIINKISSVFQINSNPEITIEINPDDITKEIIYDFRQTPVNRMSVGVQSFFNADLNYLTRKHSGKQAELTLNYLLEAGFLNISADIIYGIPTLTDENLTSNLNKLITLKIPHISAYALTVEPETRLDLSISKGLKAKVSDEQSARQLTLTNDLLIQNNYIDYEISNFCKQGFVSRHNSSYWNNTAYLGLGASAHSFNRLSRQWNIANVNKYIADIEKGILPCESEMLSVMQKYNEYVLVSLRTMWGCDMDFIELNFGGDFKQHFISCAEKFVKDGLFIQNNNIFTLTKKGKLYADMISSELFIDE